jgi:hypothetical protein
MTNYNSQNLLVGLIEYRDSLERHLTLLSPEYDRLTNRWRAFSSVAEGDYAEQFRAGWLKTGSRFQDYINRSTQLKAMLDRRIANLETLNRPEGEA